MKKILILLTALVLIGSNSVFAQNQQPKKNASTTSNNPLFVLDGLILDSNLSENDLRLSNINAITVLKGEKATSKYGVSGTDGVIEIETKRNTCSGWKLIAKKYNVFLKANPNPLFVIDGKLTEKGEKNKILGLDKRNIKSINVLSPKKGVEKYGNGGERGVIAISTKKKE